MINIESLAKEMFERFAIDQGHIAKWEYLGKDRQKIWMKDATLIADRLLQELRKEVRPAAPNNSRTSSSFELGFRTGVIQERTMIITMLQKVHEDLIKDYGAFLGE